MNLHPSTVTFTFLSAGVAVAFGFSSSGAGAIAATDHKMSTAPSSAPNIFCVVFVIFLITPVNCCCDPFNFYAVESFSVPKQVLN